MSTATPERSAQDIMAALAEPFAQDEVRFKPAVVKANRALALAYVDARTIQDRLDGVLGLDNWQDDYECLPSGSVICRLRLRIAGEWIMKVDVGSPSEQPDDGDQLKAAFSDALKRVAVKFGIGRYLYRLPQQWADYDPQRKQFVNPPTLPGAAQSKASAPANGKAPAASPAKARERTYSPRMPATGAEMQKRLYDFDAKLTAEGMCEMGDIVKHVIEAGAARGYCPDLATWDAEAIAFASEACQEFIEERKKTKKAAPAASKPTPAAASKAGKQAAPPAEPVAEPGICEEDAKSLWKMMQERGIEKEVLFAQFGIARLGELPVSRFTKAVNWVIETGADQAEAAGKRGAE